MKLMYEEWFRIALGLHDVGCMGSFPLGVHPGDQSTEDLGNGLIESFNNGADPIVVGGNGRIEALIAHDDLIVGAPGDGTARYTSTTPTRRAQL